MPLAFRGRPVLWSIPLPSWLRPGRFSGVNETESDGSKDSSLHPQDGHRWSGQHRRATRDRSKRRSGDDIPTPGHGTDRRLAAWLTDGSLSLVSIRPGKLNIVISAQYPLNPRPMLAGTASRLGLLWGTGNNYVPDNERIQEDRSFNGAAFIAWNGRKVFT